MLAAHQSSTHSQANQIYYGVSCLGKLCLEPTDGRGVELRVDRDTLRGPRRKYTQPAPHSAFTV